MMNIEDIKKWLDKKLGLCWSPGMVDEETLPKLIADCIKDLNLVEADQWISVKNRYPSDKWAPPLADFSSMKLVKNSTGISMAFYSRIDEEWYLDCPGERVEWIDKVTDWMDLPK